MADTRVNLDGVEELIEYRFRGRELGSIALNPSRGGFSRLEFLGDSILGLVVFTLAECAGAPRNEATHLVSNDHLDEVFDSTFAMFSPANTGDVIEALVGAVYLDGGFHSAASSITTAVVPRFGRFDARFVAEMEVSLTPRGLMFLGAATSKAVVADDLCRSQPQQNHRWYNDERASLIRTSRLSEISRQMGFCPPDLRGDERKDAAATDHLDEHVGRLFLSEGWDAARPLVANVLEL